MGDRDVCLRQYKERLRDLKIEFGDISNGLLSMDLDESDGLCTSQAGLEELFACGLKIKKLLLPLHHAPDPSISSNDREGVKLLKLDVPKLDGNIVIGDCSGNSSTSKQSLRSSSLPCGNR